MMTRQIVLVLAVVGLSACESPLEPAAEGFIEVTGAQLRYRLDLPDGTGPFPGVVIAHGAGMVTREAHSNDTRRLLAMGVAVLRFDKRGVGESTGRFEYCCTDGAEERIALLAGDLRAAANWLAERPEIDRGRVGFHGISQGGWIIAEALSDSSAAIFGSINSGSVLTAGLNVYYEQLTQSGVSVAKAEQKLADYDGPAYYDPVPALRSGRRPLFYGLGGDDHKTPPKANEALLSSLIADGLPIAFKVYSGAGHGLDGTDFFRDVEVWLRGMGVLPSK